MLALNEMVALFPAHDHKPTAFYFIQKGPPAQVDSVRASGKRDPLAPDRACGFLHDIGAPTCRAAVSWDWLIRWWFFQLNNITIWIIIHHPYASILLTYDWICMIYWYLLYPSFLVFICIVGQWTCRNHSCAVWNYMKGPATAESIKDERGQQCLRRARWPTNYQTSSMDSRIIHAVP